MPRKNRIKKHHPFYDHESSYFSDSDYQFCDSDDEHLFYFGKASAADHNNDNKETGSNSGLSLEKLNLQPRKKLLVLSLNGLLLYRVYRKNKDKFPTTRNPDGRFASQLGSTLCLC